MTSIQFAELCSSGQLELAKKCFKENHCISICYNGNQAFIGACKNNHIETAKWLITILPTGFDYMVYFNKALIYGRLDVMIFIMKYIPDFDVSDDQHNIFYLARSYKHYHIIQWLHTLKPDVYSIDSQGIPHCKYEYNAVRENIVPCSEIPVIWQTIIPVAIYVYILFIFVVVYYVV